MLAADLFTTYLWQKAVVSFLWFLQVHIITVLGISDLGMYMDSESIVTLIVLMFGQQQELRL